MKTDSRNSPAVIVVAIVLILLVPLLAFLQFHWLGQLSNEEYHRMQSNLQASAFHFSRDFSQELAELLRATGGEVHGSDEDILREVGRRIAAWKSSALHPTIVNTFGISSEPVDPQAMAIIMDSRSSVYLTSDLSSIAVPLGDQRHVRITLDTAYMKSTLIPALMQTYFAINGKPEYEMFIFSRDGSIFFSSTNPVPKDIPGHADAALPFISFPPMPLSMMPPGQFSRAPRPFIAEKKSPPPEEGFRDGEPAGNEMRTGPEEPERYGRMSPQEHSLLDLRIIHKTGSLEAAVNANRIRSLAISMGVLLLLGISVAFLLISSGRAQRLARQQLEFVAGVSHELRTPLSVLKSIGENLSDGIVHDKDRAQQYGNLIKDEVNRLSGLVEKALVYAGIRSGKRTYEHADVDIARIISNVTGKINEKAVGGGFTIETAVEHQLPAVSGDAAALHAAIENVITNAMKYGGENKWVGITVKQVSRNGLKLIDISVRDRGIGIPASDLRHVFKPFFRGRNATDEQIEGSGLGLSITRHIVEAHGGTISVRSTVNEGSTFTIQLPAAGHSGTHV